MFQIVTALLIVASIIGWGVWRVVKYFRTPVDKNSSCNKNGGCSCH